MKTVHLLGDSISRGWAVGCFEPSPAHQLYKLRSPWSVANLVAAENGIPVHFGFLFANLTHCDRLAQRITDKLIQAGDVVILEDAGPHDQDPDAYQSLVENVLSILSEAGAAPMVMTMFDYSPAPLKAQYSTAFTGSRSGIVRTINQAIQAAAAAYSATVIDMKAVMDEWQAYCQSQRSLQVMHSDGIHPNHWGTMRIAGKLLEVTGGLPMVRATRELQDVVVSASGHAFDGSDNQSWNAQAAADFAEMSITGKLIKM
jgi:hypothetical protein